MDPRPRRRRPPSNRKHKRAEAPLASKASTEQHSYDLISLLSIAQRYKLRSLPLAWNLAPDIGYGGTSRISQHFIDARTTFAFKRATALFGKGNDRAAYKALVKEIIILGHPSVRFHPNIMRLDGICWEVVDSQNIWPALAFQKASRGDLQSFLAGEEGANTSFQARVEICTSIASVLMVLHSCNIIHGDIKPENVLLFEEKNAAQEIVPKLSDFGYSFYGVTDDDLVCLPRSFPWNAPEHHHGHFKLKEAKSADVYSFALLCVFVLFGIDITDLPGVLRQIELKTYSHIREVDDMKRADLVATAVAELLRKADGVDDSHKLALMEFFGETLRCKPNLRTLDFERLMVLLSDGRPPVLERQANRSKAKAVALDEHFHTDFRLSTALIQFMDTDYRVRTKIFTALKHKASSTTENCSICRVKVAFQVSVCYALGFGTPSSTDNFTYWLTISCHDPVALQDELSLAKNITSDIYRSSDTQENWQIGIHEFLELYEHIPSQEVEHEYFREISDLSRVLGSTHKAVYRLVIILSDLYIAARQYEKVEEFAMSYLATQEKELGHNHPSTWGTISTLVMVYKAQKRYAETERLIQDCLRRKRAYSGEQPGYILSSMGSMVNLYREQGRTADADNLLSEVIRLSVRTLGHDHPSTITKMFQLAVSYNLAGQIDRAQELFVIVLEKRNRVLGAIHRDTLTTMAALSEVYQKQGNPEDAIAMGLKVIELRKATLGPVHSETLGSMKTQSRLYRSIDHYQAAGNLVKEMISICKKELGPRHLKTLDSIGILAVVYWDEGRWDEGEKLFVEVMKTMQEEYGLENHDTLMSMSDVVDCYSRQNRHLDALELQKDVLKYTISSRGPNNPASLNAMSYTAIMFHGIGEIERAIVLMKDVVRLQKQIYPVDHSVPTENRRLLREWVEREEEYQKWGLKWEGEERFCRDNFLESSPLSGPVSSRTRASSSLWSAEQEGRVQDKPLSMRDFGTQTSSADHLGLLNISQPPVVEGIAPMSSCLQQKSPEQFHLRPSEEDCDSKNSFRAEILLWSLLAIMRGPVREAGLAGAKQQPVAMRRATTRQPLSSEKSLQMQLIFPLVYPMNRKSRPNLRGIESLSALLLFRWARFSKAFKRW